MQSPSQDSRFRRIYDEHRSAENHSDDFDTRVSFGAWDSVAEAEQAGTLRGRYADEWAAYLDANGCTYQDPDC
ncbi:MAG: hypothetical protein V3W06_07505 [Acidimicrobiia bacterium]